MKRSTELSRFREYDALTEDQKALYDTAAYAGASHDDAMEAAETNGYTR